MSNFSKKISEITKLSTEEVDKKIALLDIPAMLKLQRAVSAGKKDEINDILKISSKLTKNDISPEDKKTPNIHKYNIGDEIEVNGETAIVKIPSAPHQTVGALIDGELQMIDKNTRQDRSIRDQLKEALGINELEDAPMRALKTDDAVDMTGADDYFDAGGEDGTDADAGDMGFDLDRMKSLAGLSTDVPALPAPDAMDSPATDPTASSLSDPAAIPLASDQITDVEEIIRAIDDIEQKILDVRLGDFKPVHQRLETMIDNVLTTGQQSVSDDQAPGTLAPEPMAAPMAPVEPVDAVVTPVDDTEEETDYSVEDMDENKHIFEGKQYVLQGMNADFNGLDEFTQGYIKSMFWADVNEDSLGGEGTENINWDDIGFENLDHHSLLKIIEDCKKFQKKAGAEAIEAYGAEQAGHDFYMTRNGHGVGFWEEDHATPEICQALDKLAKATGQTWVYIGDDEQVHVG
jgi:hypothetical protein